MTIGHGSAFPIVVCGLIAAFDWYKASTTEVKPTWNYEFKKRLACAPRLTGGLAD
jgi:hypothetical protein